MVKSTKSSFKYFISNIKCETKLLQINIVRIIVNIKYECITRIIISSHINIFAHTCFIPVIENPLVSTLYIVHNNILLVYIALIEWPMCALKYWTNWTRGGVSDFIINEYRENNAKVIISMSIEFEQFKQVWRVKMLQLCEIVLRLFTNEDQQSIKLH